MILTIKVKNTYRKLIVLISANVPNGTRCVTRSVESFSRSLSSTRFQVGVSSRSFLSW